MSFQSPHMQVAQNCNAPRPAPRGPRSARRAGAAPATGANASATIFGNPEFDSHEQIIFGHDRGSGLKAIIAIHDTRLGAAAGGCRMHPYTSEQQALADVLRLSRGMTYKSALAALPFGGGKSVILGDPRTDKSEALWHAMGDLVESLGGRYLIGEDAGTTVADLRTVSERTRYAGGVQPDAEHQGDPSPTTAHGVCVAVHTAVRHYLGADSLKGVRIAIQGLGKVGFHLAGELVRAGARVWGADVDARNVQRAVEAFGVTPTDPAELLQLDVDVLAPCALGGVLTRQSINGLKARIIAGAANNQLASNDLADHLHERGILYCPDFLINAGGIIDIHHQRQGTERRQILADVERIGPRLKQALTLAATEGTSPHQIAEAMAEERLNAAPTGARQPERGARSG